MTTRKDLYIYIDNVPKEILLIIQEFYFQNLKQAVFKNLCSMTISALYTEDSCIYWTSIAGGAYIDTFFDCLHFRRHLTIRGECKVHVDTVSIIEHSGRWSKNIDGGWYFHLMNE